MTFLMVSAFKEGGLARYNFIQKQAHNIVRGREGRIAVTYILEWGRAGYKFCQHRSIQLLSLREGRQDIKNLSRA